MNDRQDSSGRLDPCAQKRVTQFVKTLVKLAVQIDGFRLKAQAFLKRDKFSVQDDRTAQRQDNDHANKPKRDNCDDIQPTPQMEFERVYRWNALIREAQHTGHLIRKSIKTTRAIARELKEAGIDTTAPDWQENFAALRKSEWKQGAMFDGFTKLGLNPEVLSAGMKFLITQDRPLELKLLLQDLVTLSDDFSKTINEQMLKADTDAEQDAAITFDSKPVLNFILPPPVVPIVIGGAVGVAVAVGTAYIFIGIGMALAALFNATDDDIARDTIHTSRCSDLVAMPLQDRVDMINAMLSGPTLDQDETSILQLLTCHSCGHLVPLMREVGLTNLLDEFNGEEWDRLVILLRSCGFLSFADWDDDATRMFINTSDCSTLNALNLNDVRQLMLNMFEGDTLDDDENAILKLIRCLPCSRIRELTTLPGMSFEDFDDVVDGSEWDLLERKFYSCGIRE